MKFAGRAARMDRHHKRHKRSTALNLVSLMDIFTILVFFLLVNSSDVEVLPSAKDVQLPESIAETKAGRAAERFGAGQKTDACLPAVPGRRPAQPCRGVPFYGKRRTGGRHV